MKERVERTFVLLYPDYATGDYGADIFTAWTTKPDLQDALVEARQKASDACAENCNMKIPPDDFRPILVYPGHLESEADATCF